MPVFMDDIAMAGKAEHIRKGINNCARMEKEKNMFWSKENKIYDIQLKLEEKKKK